MRLLFDRGTILVREPHSGIDLSDLPGVLWDPRVQAYRAPACRHQPLKLELLRRAIQFSDEARAAGQITGTRSPIELRPYQEAALCAWELADQQALIVLPTASGKTRVAIAAAGCSRSSAAGPPSTWRASSHSSVPHNCPT